MNPRAIVVAIAAALSFWLTLAAIGYTAATWPNP